ncbi:hypothetical protein GCM10010401_07320 [Rarobacter faecitabidus]|uniref:Uncharacterized protein n=1 Tax=Rarobacter faecitabidus TaxID=13243 RepID=A0A542Z872_RARFA|nr:hypothetical protein [Rarobacter faecitabidus]TQL56537.1 hypothetical protein FB461_2426 [Rarobacter faecitabidus]
MHRKFFNNPHLRFIEEPAEPAGGKADDSAPKPAEPAAKPEGEKPLGEPGLKALQAERERASKAEKEAADLRKQIEDAGKTAEQKAADALKAAQDSAAASSLKALQYEVAAEKGIDLKLASRLVGSTKEELESDADNLKTLVGARPTGPKPDPSQGGGSTASATGVSAGRDLFADRHPSKKK